MDGENGRSLIVAEVTAIATRAKSAAATLAQAPAAMKESALRQAAAALRDAAPAILAANAADIDTVRAQGTAQDSFIDRLTLTPARIEAMAAGIDLVAGLPDPVGRELARWTRPNGLDIARVAVPLGVIGIIYESRPNVTADAGALCVKSGNAVILRGGSESFQSSAAIITALRAGLAAAGLPADAIQGMPTADRAAVGAMLALDDYIDVIIPRGGQALIRRVAAESRIPVLKHLDGNCHVYLHHAADPETAVAVIRNAKLRRVSVCGAAESLVVDRAAAARLLPPIIDALIAGDCEIRGDAASCALDPRITPADESDWAREYLDAIISVRQVDDLDAAIAHINRYGSHHTDAIITQDAGAAEGFLAGVDSAIVLVNASTQFADGGEFGFGAEIGISTGKLHARGPVGAEQLTSYKYMVRGSGQIRP